MWYDGYYGQSEIQIRITMKRNSFIRFITYGLVISCFSLPVNAQESVSGNLSLTRHEVGYSIGFIPCPYFRENDKGLEDFFYRHYGLTSPAGEKRWYHGANVTCTLNFDYLYNLNEKWAVGTYLGYSNDRGNPDALELKSDGRYVKGSLDFSMWFVLPTVRYTWRSSSDGRVQLYSGLSIGLFWQKTRFHAEESDFYTIDDNKEKYISKKWSELTGQFTFVGFSVRLKRFKFYSELGYGCRGLFTGGTIYTF